MQQLVTKMEFVTKSSSRRGSRSQERSVSSTPQGLAESSTNHSKSRSKSRSKGYKAGSRDRDQDTFNEPAGKERNTMLSPDPPTRPPSTKTVDLNGKKKESKDGKSSVYLSVRSNSVT